MSLPEQIGALKEYLGKLVEIPPTEWLHFASLLRVKTVKAGEHHFRQGEVFDEIGFLVKGLIYVYYHDADGNEAVKNFSWSGRFSSPYADLLLNRPCRLSGRAVEDTLLVTLKFSQLQKLYERHKCWEAMGRKSMEKLFLEKELRENEFLMMGAKDRYEKFCEHFSPILNRIPQYLVASYLGITPVALSRILNPKN